MRLRLSILLCCCGIALLTAPVLAQPIEEQGSIFRQWIRSQINTGRDITSVTLTEKVSRKIDGPFGVRRLDFESTTTGNPREDQWTRQYDLMWIDGQEAGPGRWQEVDQRWNVMFRPVLLEFIEGKIAANKFLSKMRPASPPSTETLDGKELTRFDTTPNDENSPIERTTLWIDEQLKQLYQSRTIIILPESGSTFVITTRYTREGNLDVPVHRTVEGSLPIKRRLRTFTALISYEATYSNVVIE